MCCLHKALRCGSMLFSSKALAFPAQGSVKQIAFLQHVSGEALVLPVQGFVLKSTNLLAVRLCVVCKRFYEVDQCSAIF